MNKIILIIFYTLSLSGKSFACINGESKILKDGTFLYDDREGNVPYGHIFYSENFKNGIKQLDNLYNSTKDLDYLSDKGLLLILTAKYKDAIELYLKIEQIQPNRYSTASNIGTAYELIGENENALKWIKKSIKIDSKSHKRSEWIHIKILEAKLKGNDFFNSDFLLNTNFGNKLIPKSELSKEVLNELSNALYYQLNERVSFVKPKDEIVAQLLFELGNIAFIQKKYYDAKSDYTLAKEYGLSNELLENRGKEIIRLLSLKKDKTKDNLTNNNFYLYLIIALIILILLFITYKRKINIA